MKSITLYVESGYSSADYYETIEVPDDTTDEELDEMAQEFRNNHIEWGWFENQRRLVYLGFNSLDRHLNCHCQKPLL